MRTKLIYFALLVLILGSVIGTVLIKADNPKNITKKEAMCYAMQTAVFI